MSEVDSGALIVAQADDQQFVMILLSIRLGQILQTSRGLSEDELRIELADSFEQTDAHISEVIRQVKSAGKALV